MLFHLSGLCSREPQKFQKIDFFLHSLDMDELRLKQAFKTEI